MANDDVTMGRRKPNSHPVEKRIQQHFIDHTRTPHLTESGQRKVDAYRSRPQSPHSTVRADPARPQSPHHTVRPDPARPQSPHVEGYRGTRVRTIGRSDHPTPQPGVIGYFGIPKAKPRKSRSRNA